MRYNRVMLGRGAVYASDCRKNNYIGAYFDINQDLTNELSVSFREFSNKFRPVVMDVTGKTTTSAGLSCGFLFTICKELQKGDVVLSPTGLGTYYVGTITSDYYYVPNANLPHRRSVEWMDIVIRRDDMSQKLRNASGSIGTCCDITKYADELQILIANAKVEPSKPSATVPPTLKNYKERDLHPLFCTTLRNSNIYAQTIYHEQAKVKVDTAQKWVHPDIVGVELDLFSHDSTLSIIKATEPRESVKIYSFELKKSIESDYQLKQYFFQALSNSSWANYGYLVAFDISDNVDNDEMKRLNNAFGIGIIEMQAKENRILFPAREHRLDYTTIEKLCILNDHFAQFIKEVSNVINAPQNYSSGAKLSLEKICDKIFDNDNEIEDYCKKNGIPY